MKKTSKDTIRHGRGLAKSLATTFCAFALGGAVLVSALSTPQAQAEKILRIGNESEPQSMDPHFVSTVQTDRIISDMFLGLLTKGPDGEPVAGAAESWTVSEDGKTYTFKIRNHTWSDGSAVTAQDFIYAWNRLLDPALGAEYASLLYTIKGARAVNTGKAGAKLAATAVDDHTLKVTLEEPAPYFLAQLSHFTAFPLPRHVVEKYGKDWVTPDHIVVNGAYKMTEWRPNVYTRLVKNKTFYDAAHVPIDQVVYYTYENRTTMQKRFRAGELDVVRMIASEQISWLRKNLADSLRIAPYIGIYYYPIRTDKEKFKDVRVRQALSLAINREAICKGVLKTGELPAYSFVPPGTANYGEPAYVSWKDMPYADKLAKAKALLSEAGYGPDNPLKFTLRYNNSENHWPRPRPC